MSAYAARRACLFRLQLLRTAEWQSNAINQFEDAEKIADVDIWTLAEMIDEVSR
jgi:hypothetical protein